MSGELLQSLVDILESAHTQQYQLSELLTSLAELKQQVQHSADQSRDKLRAHFESLRSVVNEVLDERLQALCQEVDRIEESAVTPLSQCEEMVQQGRDNAATVMQEGSLLMKNDPENNLEKIIKFKDNPITKNLTSLPEIPSQSAVPDITVEFGPPIQSKLCELVRREGVVSARAPVQITDIVERPGGVIVHWAEADDDIEVGEFWLQYAYGSIKSNENSQIQWHTGYIGPDSSSIVKHLNINKAYSFRVCGRNDPKSAWCSWSLPTSAFPTIPHFQWSSENEGYVTSNEGRTATRVSGSLTSVLYANSPSITSGEQICFRVLEAGENSFEDGVGLSWSPEDTETLLRPGAIFVDTNGKVYVDGQKMKNKLSDITRGSALVFKTEPLSNGKVRVSVEANEKEVTFDWKVESTGGASNISPMSMNAMPLSRQFSAHQLFFAMKFTHEDWKIAVE